MALAPAFINHQCHGCFGANSQEVLVAVCRTLTQIECLQPKDTLLAFQFSFCKAYSFVEFPVPGTVDSARTSLVIRIVTEIRSIRASISANK
jgi:hypothetical protein